MNKICNSCQVQKDLSHFYNKKRGLHGVAAICKPCRKSYDISWYKSNRFRISENNKIKHANRKAAST